MPEESNFCLGGRKLSIGRRKEEEEKKKRKIGFKAAERTAQWVRAGARGRCCPELFRVGDA